MGLKENMLADGSTSGRSVKNDAGLTEETDKKIQEALQNCH
jgi:hypothetical protein